MSSPDTSEFPPETATATGETAAAGTQAESGNPAATDATEAAAGGSAGDTRPGGAESADDRQPEDPLNAALREVAQWREVALRSAAELDNYRKRMARELQDSVKYGSSAVLEALLPILDNFDYGLQAAKPEPGAPESNLYTGLTMVLKQFQNFLRDQGVEEVPTDGAVFDPKVHDAVAQEAHPTIPEGTIISRVRKGYKLHDRLLRPATVVVSSGPDNSTKS